MVRVLGGCRMPPPRSRHGCSAISSGRTVADLCAAPGGKTMQLALAGGSVTAIDRAESRMARLAENLGRLGLTATAVVAAAEAWQGGPFDAVLVDAPCTATGTIRRHPDIPWRKVPADIVALAALQRRLLDNAISLARPGGTIVFCTCSLEPEEGEDIIRAALGEDPRIAREPLAVGEFPGLEGLVTAEWRPAHAALPVAACRSAARRARRLLCRPPEAPVNRCSAPVALGKPFVMLWNDRHAAFAVRRRDHLPCPS